MSSTAGFCRSGSVIFQDLCIFAPTLQIELYDLSAQPVTHRRYEWLLGHAASNFEYLVWLLVVRAPLFARLRQPFRAARPYFWLSKYPAGFHVSNSARQGLYFHCKFRGLMLLPL